MSVIVNVIRNAMRPGYGSEMIRKAVLRISDGATSDESARAAAWCRESQIDAKIWARRIDAGLWEDAERFAQEQDEIAERLASERGERVGGGGFYALLYFVSRLLRPQVIVETGVAFGYSSRAFLRALSENGSGHLFSSDFPYVRQPDPEGLIGLLVELQLRARWTLLVGSDRDNLPKISSRVNRIDLLHYDSDKTRSGRDFALATLGARMAPEALIIFDDIQNNMQFHDLARSRPAPYLVFEFNGKWLGVTGGPAVLYAHGAQRR